MKHFDAGTIDTQTLGFANLLPGSLEWRAKNIPTTNLHKLIRGMSNQIFDLEKIIEDVANDLDIRYTTDLIQNWERAFGIPNETFKIDVDIIQRRAQVLAILQAQGCTTVADFINLIEMVFGYKNVGIIHGVDEKESHHPPYKVPFRPYKDLGGERWTWYIYGDGLIPVNHPPYKVPFQPSGADTPMTKFVQKLKPLNTILIFKNNPPPFPVDNGHIPPDNNF